MLIYEYNYSWNFSFFILRTEFHVACTIYKTKDACLRKFFPNLLDPLWGPSCPRFKEQRGRLRGVQRCRGQSFNFNYCRG
jgi:hypothetical protein